MSGIADNPYVGPRTFTRDEADRFRFYGREQEANDLRALVVTERLVLFYAQSGAGKSSLINARLIPQLQQAGFAVLPVGRVSGEMPESVGQVDNIFTFNLIRSLEQGDTDPTRFRQMSLSHFITHLASDDGERYYYDDSPVADEPEVDEPRHILIIDQFEEIVTHYMERWPECEAFFRQLDRAMADDPLLWVVLTLREDYIAALEPFAPLLAGKMRARYYMQPMGTEAAMKAVKRPAWLFARPFATGVAETLVDNLSQIRVHGQQETASGQYVEPVQLQVVCYEMWANLAGQQASEITKADLRAAGDVDSALADFYERILAQTLRDTTVSEGELRQWFDQRLITEGRTRGTVYQGGNETAGLPNTVVESLANRFLLRAEMRSGGIWYELVHDRFVEPILKANQVYLLKKQAEKVRRRYWRLAIIAAILGAILLLWLAGPLLLNSTFWITRCLPNCPNENLSSLDLSGTNLPGANLSGANLTGTDLGEAVLSRADLSGADLSGANLPRADLSEANLSQANLSRANLFGADLSFAHMNGADLNEVDLRGTDLFHTDLSGANLREGDLRGGDLRGADLSGADLSGTVIDDSTQLDDKWRLVWEIVNQDASGLDLVNADLSGANLSRANLRRADLSGANLYFANLSGAELNGAELSGAELNGAQLSEAKIDDSTQLDDKWRLVWEIVNQGASGLDLVNAELSGANLSKANLFGAALINADLFGADLSRADLSRANLILVNLSGANLSGANLSSANLGGANLGEANLSEADLSGADLESASLIGAELSGANLGGTNLGGAFLSLADLSEAKYNENTIWPEGFDPEEAGAVLVE